mmetsp:Transcript_14870/g.30024  ORF Transcript_14870/g.30024 Transcript_14870/m.30024 type:complete len:86 (+) Transcript_14870:1967-2224(+)
MHAALSALSLTREKKTRTKTGRGANEESDFALLCLDECGLLIFASASSLFLSSKRRANKHTENERPEQAGKRIWCVKETREGRRA